MSLQQSFEPREVLPYSDGEIRDLYVEALKAENGGTIPSSNRAIRLAVAASPINIIEAAVISIAADVVVSSLASFSTGTYAALMYGFLAMVAAGSALVLVQPHVPVGPISWMIYWRRLRSSAEQLKNIDPYNAHVLRFVVNYIARSPIMQADEITSAIAANRERIAKTLSELSAVSTELRSELLTTEDTGMRLLIEAKHDGATGTARKLMELDTALAAQANEAENAVAPIRELCFKFEKVQRLSGTLSRIQAAYGLVEESKQNIEDQHLQLSLLKAASASAMARLHEIQTIVDAQESARTEIATF